MGNHVPSHPRDSEDQADTAPPTTSESEGQYPLWDDGEKQYELGYN